MTIRPLRDSDIPILQEFAERSGFPYPDLSHSHIEAISVIADADDRPIMACAAKRLVELYLYVDSEASPGVKMNALSMLHRGMAETLRAKGYNVCEAFLPPIVSGIFGRRLERTWGWIKNWPSWTVRF